jgi:hypothetical protein
MPAMQTTINAIIRGARKIHGVGQELHHMAQLLCRQPAGSPIRRERALTKVK